MPNDDEHASGLNDHSFLQPCDVCGRLAIVRFECSGERVGCRHCGGTFVAIGNQAIGLVVKSSLGEREVRRDRWSAANSGLLRIAASFLTAVANLFGEPM